MVVSEDLLPMAGKKWAPVCYWRSHRALNPCEEACEGVVEQPEKFLLPALPSGRQEPDQRQPLLSPSKELSNFTWQTPRLLCCGGLFCFLQFWQIKLVRKEEARWLWQWPALWLALLGILAPHQVLPGVSLTLLILLHSSPLLRSSIFT